MFGMGDEKKDTMEVSYELEEELKDPAKYKELEDKILGRIAECKKILNEGLDPDDVEPMVQMAHGYVSMLAVIQRFKEK